MKKLLVALGCVVLLLTACGDDKDNKTSDTVGSSSIQSKQKKSKRAPILNQGKDTEAVRLDTVEFLKKFDKFDPAQKYYFCAAFAMGAMSVVKPVTASAMVNYFMGLGVAKYNVGINEDTYKAFSAGKNTFKHENQVNAILKRKVCENIMNEAADFARVRNYQVADLDKRGKKEVEKVVMMIRKERKK